MRAASRRRCLDSFLAIQAQLDTASRRGTYVEKLELVDGIDP